MKRILWYLVAILWVNSVCAQIEMENNAKLKFNGNNIINVAQVGNTSPTRGYYFSLSPGLFIERAIGNSSGGIFISEATAVVLWAGSYPGTQLVQFGQNTGSTFRVPAYIDNSGALKQNSDSTLKTHISPVSNVIPKLQSIRAYRYQFKSQLSQTAGDNTPSAKSSTMQSQDSLSLQAAGQRVSTSLEGQPQTAWVDTATVPYNIGFMAQELEKAYPELVETYQGVKYVNYMGMVPILLQAINEQQAVINQQQRKLQEQEARINALQAEVAAIKKYLKIK